MLKGKLIFVALIVTLGLMACTYATMGVVAVRSMPRDIRWFGIVTGLFGCAVCFGAIWMHVHDGDWQYFQDLFREEDRHG
jgi:hypothetical protein